MNLGRYPAALSDRQHLVINVPLNEESLEPVHLLRAALLISKVPLQGPNLPQVRNVGAMLERRVNLDCSFDGLPLRGSLRLLGNFNLSVSLLEGHHLLVLDEALC